MAILNVEVLKEIVEKLPNDFEVEFVNYEGAVAPLSDNISVKVSEKKLVLKLH